MMLRNMIGQAVKKKIVIVKVTGRNKMDQPYYKILQEGKELTVVCLQWFDEKDYDYNQWLTDDKFETEAQAYVIINCIQAYLGKVGMSNGYA
jgi:hypothetical protein